MSSLLVLNASFLRATDETALFYETSALLLREMNTCSDRYAGVLNGFADP